MLYFKELKKVCLSAAYFLFLLLLIFGWYKNFYGVTVQEIAGSESSPDSPNTSMPFSPQSASILQKPDPKSASYAAKNEVPENDTVPNYESSEKIICGGTDQLLLEYGNNSYATYPFGYYKEVTLSDDEQKRILRILCEITGLTKDELSNLPDNYFPAINGDIVHITGDVSADKNKTFTIDAADGDTQNDPGFISHVSYERFKELMDEVEGIVGEGSNYSMEMLLTYYGQTEMNYDEALTEYNKTIYEDKVSTAFARLFCDFTGLSLGLYPVFVAASFWLTDRKNKISALIDSRQASTVRIIVMRFLAMVTAIMLPVILLSFESLIPLLRYSSRTGIAIDVFAFLKYILWWLLPTAAVVLSFGTFVTILTATPAAVILQIVWWFIDSGVTGLSGDTDLFTLMLRHNTLNGSELIQQNLTMICLNRGLLLTLSFLCIFLSCMVYDRKRKGKI